jgi:aspartyl-tRNA(Asn)/glutamyl-tRNA(Gln) amidotransferase subunit A
MSITELTGAQIAAKVKNKELTAREVTDAFLARIATNDAQIQAFLTVTADQARAQADAIDAKIASGESVGALAGVPVALKDNLCTKGVETTCGSKILKGFVPPYNATVVEKLVAAGAISLGKVNMDEFAMGSSCENSAYFPTRNPWNTQTVPGGSSGGSAAAVAADFAPFALGSDTGGSIRQPAAYCGIVGLKPTYGCVSRYGLVAYASSLDQIGPMTRTVEDAALMMNAIAGVDPYDSTSVPRNVPDYTKALSGDLTGVKIGIPNEYFAEGITTEVKASVFAAIGVLRGLGATVIENISLPSTDYALAAYYVVAPAEASSNLARYDGVRYGPRAKGATGHIDLFEKTREEGFGPEVKQRILTGTYALSAGYYDAFYMKGMQVRTLLRQEFDRAFTQCDALATPTAPTTAFGIGEKTDDPLAMKLSDICTIPANMAGIPALSLPCGFDATGLPIGLQLMGPAFTEEILLKIGYAYQQATDWHTRRPPSGS